MILDVNECQTESPCDSNATCNNTDGSYVCACNIGYSGDGFICTGKLICMTWIEMNEKHDTKRKRL